MNKTITDTIMMVRPSNFGFNEETASNNSFQTNDTSFSVKEIRKKAIEEFDNMVEILTLKGINVRVFDDSPNPVKPDAVFPNNWFSMHTKGVFVTYPMYAENRRLERDENIIAALKSEFGHSKVYTFEYLEEKEQFLEGTGSMILDRENKIVYACLSPRTDIRVIHKFTVLMEYQKVTFLAMDTENNPIYHTNVMMAIGKDFAVICLECIPSDVERKEIIRSLERTNKTVIEISLKQVKQFAGNMLQVLSNEGADYLIMSQTAYDSLNKSQIKSIEKFTQILSIPIPTIEKFGGGSVRCMIGEIFA